jgi:hypothetical protein
MDLKRLKIANIFSNKNRKGTTQINECEYCGRKVGKNPLYVHITTDGDCIPNDISVEELEKNGFESQGCFPIGNCCAKKLFGDKIEEYCQKQ